MSNTLSIKRHIKMMYSEDIGERTQAKGVLQRFKDEPLPYLAAQLTKHSETTNQDVLRSIIQTILGIKTENAPILLYFIANPDPRIDLWSDNVKSMISTILDEAGYEPPGWALKSRGIEKQFLVFLLGVDDDKLRSSAKKIIVSMLHDIHPEAFSVVLEDQALCKNFDSRQRLANRLGQERFAQPEAIFEFLAEIDKNGIILHGIVCNPRTAIYILPEIREVAIDIAQMLGIDTSNWDVMNMNKLKNRQSNLDAVEFNFFCDICNKRQVIGKGMRLSSQLYFCSKECYGKALTASNVKGQTISSIKIRLQKADNKKGDTEMTALKAQQLLEQASKITTRDPRGRGEEMEGIARQIAPLGDVALPSLIEAMKSPNQNVSGTARIALIEMEGLTTFEAMRELLREGSNPERDFVVRWIQKFSTPEIVSKAASDLTDGIDSKDQYQSVVIHLAKIGGEAALDILIDRMRLKEQGWHYKRRAWINEQLQQHKTNPKVADALANY